VSQIAAGLAKSGGFSVSTAFSARTLHGQRESAAAIANYLKSMEGAFRPWAGNQASDQGRRKGQSDAKKKPAAKTDEGKGAEKKPDAASEEPKPLGILAPEPKRVTPKQMRPRPATPSRPRQEKTGIASASSSVFLFALCLGRLCRALFLFVSGDAVSLGCIVLRLCFRVEHGFRGCSSSGRILFSLRPPHGHIFATCNALRFVALRATVTVMETSTSG
jgi:hypothetical protein